jgi:hypothetical protein
MANRLSGVLIDVEDFKISFIDHILCPEHS